MGGHELLSPGHPLSAPEDVSWRLPQLTGGSFCPLGFAPETKPSKGLWAVGKNPLEVCLGAPGKAQTTARLPLQDTGLMLKPSLLTFLPGERPCRRLVFP